MPDAALLPDRHRAGEAGFRRASVALFAAGVATFALLFSPQALLPLLSDSFSITPAASALVLAVTTAALGLSLVPAGWLADAYGRTRVMKWSLLLASLLGLACAAAPSFEALLALRALQGIALAGLPAVAMAYLAEEIHGSSLGLSIGLYIGGNAIGGMLGRLLTGVFADHGGWRVALLGVGGMALVCALTATKLLPASQHFHSRPFQPGRLVRGMRVHLTEPGLLRLDAVGALLMATFAAVYNGLTFRLEDAPYGLSHAAVAAIFLVYPIGSFSSAWAGRLADRIGRRGVLPAAIVLAGAGLALTGAHALPLIVLGVATLTAGFFAGHSVASSWVGRRGSNHAGSAAQASALYLLAYYAGSSLGGIAAGAAWSGGQWTAVMSVGGTLLGCALLMSLWLRQTPPLPTAVPAVA
ncbi:MFS transporter [Conexibacter sp. CPCC 206217]|uniref:MFS transporter n=1 Tax=Conexibacter sp. CPCC 206217 TaxID=3064574 RepID=UPI002717BB30|nr:MFS transporter [Conexibacter sp. CPCC 206217]MDO8209677.1 MFS transporter [Conexibacter sp. CPCC 206217]